MTSRWWLVPALVMGLAAAADAQTAAPASAGAGATAAPSSATRLLFLPTGRSLRSGEAYLGVYEFLLPFVQVGITDRLSMGVGTPLIFFGDESGRPIWLTPKFQFYKGSRTTAAVGVMHFVFVGEEPKAGLAYVVSTTGTDDKAFTVAAAWAYTRYHTDRSDYGSCSLTAMCPVVVRELKTPGSPVVMAGGEYRVSRRVKLITENYGFKHGGIASVGVRFAGKSLSADVGIFAPFSSDADIVAAPIVNFAWTFGK